MNIRGGGTVCDFSLYTSRDYAGKVLLLLYLNGIICMNTVFNIFNLCNAQKIDLGEQFCLYFLFICII